MIARPSFRVDSILRARSKSRLKDIRHPPLPKIVDNQEATHEKIIAPHCREVGLVVCGLSKTEERCHFGQMVIVTQVLIFKQRQNCFKSRKRKKWNFFVHHAFNWFRKLKEVENLGLKFLFFVKKFINYNIFR